MALSDCVECWQTPCVCGHDYKCWSKSQKNELTKAINGFTADDIFEWLESNGYLTDYCSKIQEEFEKRNK